MSITLAIGVARMAQRRAVIRRLPAVETLGSTTVICSEKTGTLTENQMTVQSISAGDEALEVSGVGHSPSGTILKEGEPFNPSQSPVLMECLRAGLLCSDNFATIEAAVEEGRGVFENLSKFIVWTLPTNLGEGHVILLAIIAGVTLPILPVQNLWINMVTAVLLGLNLAFEPKEPGIHETPPARPEDAHPHALPHLAPYPRGWNAHGRRIRPLRMGVAAGS